MTFQLVRGEFEKRTRDGLIGAGVPSSAVFFDNVGENPPRDGSYAVISISFTDVVVDTVSCEGVEDLRGSLSVNVYTSKNRGSKEGEDICLAVLKAWIEINKYSAAPADTIRTMVTRSLEGPYTIAPTTQTDQQQAKHINNVACSWLARTA